VTEIHGPIKHHVGAVSIHYHHFHYHFCEARGGLVYFNALYKIKIKFDFVDGWLLLLFHLIVLVLTYCSSFCEFV